MQECGNMLWQETLCKSQEPRGDIKREKLKLCVICFWDFFFLESKIYGIIKSRETIFKN